MDYIFNIFIVFFAGLLELWLAIPLGFLLKLPPFITAVVSALGSISAVVIVALAGDKLRSRFLKWHYGTDEGLKKSRMHQIWNQYGVIGLGLLSPLLFGAPLGTALGIVLSAEKNKLLFWMAVGIIIWSAGLTAAIFLGLITITPNL
ncbi:MAG TPA: small multi-drug export protein [Methanobacterium sp.]|nr:small multi-drug export protein [Methanobacterium sp.]